MYLLAGNDTVPMSVWRDGSVRYNRANILSKSAV